MHNDIFYKEKLYLWSDIKSFLLIEQNNYVMIEKIKENAYV